MRYCHRSSYFLRCVITREEKLRHMVNVFGGSHKKLQKCDLRITVKGLLALIFVGRKKVLTPGNTLDPTYRAKPALSHEVIRKLITEI